MLTRLKLPEKWFWPLPEPVINNLVGNTYKIKTYFGIKRNTLYLAVVYNKSK